MLPGKKRMYYSDKPLEMKELKPAIYGWFLLTIIMVTLSGCWKNAGEDSLKHSVIWRISGNELPGPSYLFGTVHLLDSNDLSLYPTILEQLKRSDVLVLENDLSDPAYQRRALAMAMMAHDSLDNILTPVQYEELQAFFMDEFNFPVTALNKMKPFYLASLIAALDAGENSGSHEEQLLRVARKEEKKIMGLASLEKETEILAAIPIHEQVEYLFDEIGLYRNGQAEAIRKDIHRAYQQADLTKIAGIIAASLKDHPAVFKQLFIARNESWIPAMTDMMKKQSCFFAVGVGHLPGEKGLLRLLQSEGYKLVPVHKDFWFHD